MWSALRFVNDKLLASAIGVLGTGYDAYAMAVLAPLEREYAPWTSSAMRPGAVSSIINEIVINDRKLVVEFGSGLSTIYFARAIRHHGHRQVVSFDHDAAWASFVARCLKAEGLDERAQVVHAPLEKCPGYETDWYDIDIVRRALDSRSIDILVIDGPPAYSGAAAMARLPAVPIVADLLSDDCAVFLDDAQRLGERQVLKQWSRLTKIKFKKYLVKGSFAAGYRGKAFHAVI